MGIGEGKRSNRLPLHHTPVRKGTCPQNIHLDTMSYELWVMKQLTTHHVVKDPGQRRGRFKGWGTRLEWVRETGIHQEHNWPISEYNWEGIWIYSWTSKLLPASFFLSQLEEGLDLSILICLRGKRLQIDRRKKGIQKCHFLQKEGEKLSCFLLSPSISNKL